MRSRRPRRPIRWLAAAAALAAALPAAPARAQVEFDITGVVVDSTGAGVGGAMVVALALPDSVLTKWAQTGGDGAFGLRVAPGEYLLQVTLIGHQTVRRALSVTDGDVAAGTIALQVSAVGMDPLVVRVEHIPFLNRRDTLSYNALAFETRPNANVEDLLRRLPGVEVERDGSIKAQGEDVENVLVDGKEFFGSDPTIATRNLRADAIQRVDVYDKQSDRAEFTGIPDGEEARTIDLKLKEGAKHGYFGRVSGALGADMGDYGSLTAPGEVGSPGSSGEGDTSPAIGAPVESRIPYDGTLSINRFSPTTQLAVISNANNVNQAGFSWGDYLNFMGGARGLAAEGKGRGGGVRIGGGRDDGFTETLALGLNASHDFGSKNWVRTSYFLSSLDNLQNRTLQQQQLLGSEFSSLVDETSSEQADNLTHRLDLNAQVTLSEGHDLRLRGNLNAGSSSLASVAFRETRTATGQPLNTAATDYLVDGDDLGGNGQLTWRKRLSENGRSLFAEARLNLSDSELLGELSSTVRGDPLDPRATRAEILQEQSRTGRTLGHTVRLSLTEPLARNTVLEIFGERSAIDEDQEKSIFDIEAGTPVFNDLLSSAFERTYTYLRGGLRFNRSTQNTRFVLGLQIQSSDLDGVVLDRDEEIANGYTHLLPLADLRLQLDDARTLNFRYTTSTREPSMTELQPFTDNSDPLRVYVGNPDLQPEYTHRLAAEYRSFDQFSFVHLFAYARLGYTTDAISQSRTVDPQGLQLFSPVNVGGVWNANGGVNFGTPVRSIGARLNLNYNVTYSRSTEIVNEAENDSRIWQNTLGFELENRVKDVFDVSAGGKLTHNHVGYSLSEELNQSYLNSIFFGSGALYLGPWTLETSLDLRLFDQDVFGESQNVALWEASISRLFLNDRVEVQLTAFDLLNQHRGVSLNSSPSFIQEQRIESLGQYFMLRFVYHLGPRSVRETRR